MAMAIAGIMSVPLAGVIAAQLRVPLEIADENRTASRLQSSITLLTNDAVSSQSFTLVLSHVWNQRDRGGAVWFGRHGC